MSVLLNESLPDVQPPAQRRREAGAVPRSEPDRLALLTARACTVPIAMLVAWDHERAVLRSGTGFAEHERDGLIALCGAFLEMPDRLAVLPPPGAPDIHFLRALPLQRGDGALLGVLAVMDRVPRILDAGQEEDLAALAALAASQLELQQHRDQGPGVAAKHDPTGNGRRQTDEDVPRMATHLGITLENITEGFYTLDAQWRFTYLNKEGARLLRTSGTALLGKNIWEAFPDVVDTAFSEQVQAAVATNQQVEFEARYAPSDKWFEVRAHPFPDGLAVYFRDISKQRQARERLMLLETSISRLNDMVIIAEAVPSGKPGLRIIFVNNAFERHTGYGSREAMGQSPRMLCGPLTERAELMRMATAFRHGEPVQAQLIAYKKNGRHFWMEVDIVPVTDDVGIFFTHWVAVGRDITRRKASESEIRHLAFYDALTQLPNRQLLMNRLHKTLGHNQQQPRAGALMFIDLDNFKALNDTMGHQKGDLLLQKVAKRLSACVRPSDMVARLGGDEFVVLLEDLDGAPQTAAAQARETGEKILAALREPYSLTGYQHYSTCSIGITSFDHTEHAIGDLLKQADLVMYQAKVSGRNTLCFFDPAMQAAVSANATLQSDLRQGLRENQFLLHYQPQVGRDGRMTGVEALLRWQHGSRGLVGPTEFIAAAEEGALILPLGQWALETACRQLAAWSHRPDTAALSIAVNVSVRQFRHSDFVDLVMAALKETGVSPYKLKLELTESLLADDMDVTISKMSRLKDMGVTLSLDDFGMGYSSLSCLKRLPLDQLKIDKSFVADILRDPNDAAIARTIIGLAQSLGLGVVAEGVETEGQRDFLSRHGCECYQGYLFCKPLPIDALEDFMKTLNM